MVDPMPYCFGRRTQHQPDGPVDTRKAPRSSARGLYARLFRVERFPVAACEEEDQIVLASS